MNIEPKTEKFLPMSEVARRAGVAQVTAAHRLERAGLKPDGEIVAGTRRSLIFALTRYPTLQRAICTPEAIA